jgi:hypothetical protein
METTSETSTRQVHSDACKKLTEMLGRRNRFVVASTATPEGIARYNEMTAEIDAQTAVCDELFAEVMKEMGR